MSDSRYTYEEMEIARFTDLPALAESFGHEVQARGRWHFLKDAQHIVIKNRTRYFDNYKQDWGEYYRQGGLLIADRYTTSNAVHQTSKLPPEQRRPFLDWLFHFEYDLLELPRPTRVLYLDLPTELSEQMMRLREQATHTTADVHEQDEDYLRRCRENAAFVTDYCGWTRIDCARDGVMRSREEIHAEVLDKLRDLL